MTSIRLCKPERGSRLPFQGWAIPEKWANVRLPLAGWIAVFCILAFLPGFWVNTVMAREEDAWFLKVSGQAEMITQSFCATPDPEKVIRGDEPAVREMLAYSPLTYAVADPGAARIWVRDGAGLVPLRDEDALHKLLKWATMARGSGKMTWCPERGISGEQSDSFTLVTLPSGLVAIKRWAAGSPEVDAFLKPLMVGKLAFRFGVVKKRYLAPGQHDKQVPLPEKAGSPFQISDLAGPVPYRQAWAQKRAFADTFMPVIGMTDQAYREQRRVRALRATIAWGLYGVCALFSGAVLVLLARTQARRQMDARRLAALAHSLKTPLAILKMRCDSALNPDLPRERQEAHLLRVGDGAEQLLHLIEHGLEPFRVHPSTMVEASIPPRFFVELEEEMSPIFGQMGRVLEIHGGAMALNASSASLHSALSILLENALLHGQGMVRLSTLVDRRKTTILVQDEGPGIGKEGLLQLGEPVRKGLDRPPTAIGKSQGLGLSLLTSLARREGWGILLSYGDPGGFTVGIEIRH